MARHSDHDRIAHKAHELWEAEGRPHGRDQDHWDQAREIIAVEDSQSATLKPRRSGARAPVEQPEAALRNLADMPNLTDQGENLLTSTDREPPLTATPSGRKGRMPKAEVPTSDQPGMPTKTRKAAKTAPAATDKPAKAKAAPKAAAPAPTTSEAEPPKTASVPKTAASGETKQEEFTPRKGSRRKTP